MDSMVGMDSTGMATDLSDFDGPGVSVSAIVSVSVPPSKIDDAPSKRARKGNILDEMTAVEAFNRVWVRFSICFWVGKL